MRSQITGVLNKLTTAILCAAILWLPSGTSSAPVVFVDELTKTTVDREAAKYTRAVNDLGGIANLSLKTESDFKRASSIIGSQTENLSLVRYRMIQMALSNTEFTKAVESELEKTKGNAGEMLRRFRENPSSLTNLNGARQVQQSIDRELRTDLQNLNKAGEHMKNSAASIRNKQANAHSARREEVEYAREVSPYNLAGGNNYFEVLFAASGIVAGAVGNRYRNVKGASQSPPSGDHLKTEAQQQKYQECLNRASEQHSSCKTRCPAGAFQWLCLANCDASYMITKAGCLTILFN